MFFSFSFQPRSWSSLNNTGRLGWEESSRTYSTGPPTPCRLCTASLCVSRRRSSQMTESSWTAPSGSGRTTVPRYWATRTNKRLSVTVISDRSPVVDRFVLLVFMFEFLLRGLYRNFFCSTRSLPQFSVCGLYRSVTLTSAVVF